jgi:Cdc6-like AAA superfamily ATPase
LEQARILLGRTLLGKAEKSLMLTGLRGVGKTVLLNEVWRMAQDSGYRMVLIEAHEDKSLGSLIAGPLKSVFF